jgi:hypothetical protein
MVELMDSGLINRGEFGRFSYYPLAMQDVLKPGSVGTNEQLQNSQLVLKMLCMLYLRYLTRLRIHYWLHKCRT